MEENTKMTLGKKVRYSVTETGLLMVAITISTQLMYFLTDVVGIAAATVGTMFLLTRIWDAVNDIIMGIIVDKNKSKLGKYKPYIIFGGIAVALTIILNFSAPDLSYGGKVAYMYLVYILYGMAYTVVFIPYTTMMINITDTDKDRTSLSSMKGAFQMGGVLIASMLTVPLVTKFGGGELNATGYQTTAIVFAVATLTLISITFFGVRENKDKYPKTSDLKYDFKTIKRVILTNKPLMLVMSIYFLIYFRIYLNNLSATYFFVWRLDRPELIGPYLGIATGATILTSFFAPKLSMKFGKKTLISVAMILAAVGYIGMFAARTGNIGLLLGSATFAGLTGGIPSLLIWAYVGEVAEYTAKKEGKRYDGMVYAAVSFFGKLAAGLSGWFSGIILTYYGYIANQPQTERALLGIDIVFLIVPAICMLLIIVPVVLYKVDTSKNQLK